MPEGAAAEPLVYNPYAYEMHEDPYPVYARLRAEAPVYRNEEIGIWALSRHADVLAAFKDTVRMSNKLGVSIEPSASVPGEAAMARFWSYMTCSECSPVNHPSLRSVMRNLARP